MISHTAKWEEMSKSERDAWIAEHVMGLVWVTVRPEKVASERDSVRWLAPPEILDDESPDHESPFTRATGEEPITPGQLEGVNHHIRSFTTLTDAAFAMEEAIAGRGVAAMRAYAFRLSRLVNDKAFSEGATVVHPLVRAFMLAHASPAQRALAAYLAFAEQGGRP